LGAVNPELPEKALDPIARLPDQDAPENRLVLRRILTQDQDTGSPIETATMKDRAPLQAKVTRGINRGAWYLGDEGPKRL
jgi:hypothetical protein